MTWKSTFRSQFRISPTPNLCLISCTVARKKNTSVQQLIKVNILIHRRCYSIQPSSFETCSPSINKNVMRKMLLISIFTCTCVVLRDKFLLFLVVLLTVSHSRLSEEPQRTLDCVHSVVKCRVNSDDLA